MKKLIILIFIMLLSVLLLCSCISSDYPDDGTEDAISTTANQDEYAGEDLVLCDKGESDFTIVRGEYEADEVVTAASTLRTELSRITSATIKISDDYLRDGETHDNSTYEILFGNTNYAQSIEVNKTMTYGSYKICVVGRKIVIAANDGASASKAVSDFSIYVKSIMENKKAVITSDYYNEKVVNPTTSLAPVYTGGIFETSYIGQNGDIAYIYKSTSAQEFNEYITYSSTKGGCTIYTSFNPAQNLSVTLTKDNAIINAYFNEVDDTARIIIESNVSTTLPNNEATNASYKTVCTTQLTQLGLEYPYNGGGTYFSEAVKNSTMNAQIGMCYIFRLSDSSFIIIDGGYSFTRNVTEIYNTLYEQAVDKNNIVIAAWIFTHTHGDHIGAYRSFLSSYASKVKVERLIYNFGTADEYTSVNENSNNANLITSSVTTLGKGVKRIIAHPGQVHYTRNAKIEIIHTPDLMRPKAIYGNGNSLCIAFRITLGEQTFLFPGDSNTDMTALLCKNFGTYLKSDFVQVIHHGAEGGSNEFYQLVDPTVVLWPLGTYDYFSYRKIEEWHTYLFTSPNVKEIILSGYTDRTLPIPYTYPTTKIVPDIPDSAPNDWKIKWEAMK